ncbi:aspartate/glutamate racemase family protein [Salinibacillus xinjiangensis]|uniref:Aspartate/glutamate racemase family protein n=1 Tax=Salinibacillus xinjiangensis TaxID=1229268 RepID=A0A6G1X4W7_9BACI|nr:aspartate/glutamate racemase family protein [Salinibacillus xinjiangensis]MRG86043.1 aspartate/glutamate racemase family protein [Salinibacillus xinjiangensis]
MLLKANKGQVSYGESIGILLLDTFTPFIPGDVGNATTYSFPVRYQTVKGFTFDKLLEKDESMLEPILEAGQNLVNEGVKAITSDCGYMAMYQQEIANELKVPVFMSSLLQIPFLSSMLRMDEKIGIICSKASDFEDELLVKLGINPNIPLAVKGMEGKENFVNAAHEEIGTLNPELIEKEVVEVAQEMVQEDSNVKLILLECSSLPPYAASVQRAVNLPVFDFVTMINYVQSALVQSRFTGFM